MRLVCTIGMHRSGTSVVARLVNLLGVHLGDDEDLLPAAPDNPKGYWENSSLSALDDWVLERMGGSWDDPPPLPAGWERSTELDEIRVHAAEALERTLGGHELVGFKDPRASLTLPFWNTLAPVAASIMCLRHPSEVAGSLQARNGFDPERSARLWLRYTAEAFVADPAPLVVEYGEVLDDPPGTAARLAEFLELPPPSPEALAAMAEFVEPALRHHKPDTSSAGPAMELAEAVYELLATERSRQAMRPVLQALVREWNGAARRDAQLEELGRLAASVAESQQRQLEFDEELRRSLVARVEAAEEHAGRFQDELAASTEQVHAARAESEVARAKSARLEVELAATHEAGLAAVARAEAAEGREAELRAALDAQRAELDGVRAELDGVRAERDRLAQRGLGPFARRLAGRVRRALTGGR